MSYGNLEKLIFSINLHVPRCLRTTPPRPNHQIELSKSGFLENGVVYLWWETLESISIICTSEYKRAHGNRSELQSSSRSIREWITLLWYLRNMVVYVRTMTYSGLIRPNLTWYGTILEPTWSYMNLQNLPDLIWSHMILHDLAWSLDGYPAGNLNLNTNHFW